MLDLNQVYKAARVPFRRRLFLISETLSSSIILGKSEKLSSANLSTISWRISSQPRNRGEALREIFPLIHHVIVKLALQTITWE